MAIYLQDFFGSEGYAQSSEFTSYVRTAGLCYYCSNMTVVSRPKPLVVPWRFRLGFVAWKVFTNSARRGNAEPHLRSHDPASKFLRRLQGVLTLGQFQTSSLQFGRSEVSQGTFTRIV